MEPGSESSLDQLSWFSGWPGSCGDQAGHRALRAYPGGRLGRRSDGTVKLPKGFEINLGVVSLLLGACLLLAGMIVGFVSFGALAGVGVIYALDVGLICAVVPGGTKPTFADSANIRNHWRGHLQVAAAMIVVGSVGAGLGALFG